MYLNFLKFPITLCENNLSQIPKSSLGSVAPYPLHLPLRLWEITPICGFLEISYFFFTPCYLPDYPIPIKYFAIILGERMGRKGSSKQ